MIRIEGGGKKVTTNWYSYEAKNVIESLDDDVFDRKKYISADDIIDHVIYSNHGCFDLLDVLKGLKARLKTIEDQLLSGKWLTNTSAALPTLLSSRMDSYITDVYNVKKLDYLSTLIREDLYKNYFSHIVPDIVLSKPKVPKFPKLPVQTYPNKSENYSKIKKLIKDTIPYLNVLEGYHHEFYDLIAEANAGLDAIISR